MVKATRLHGLRRFAATPTSFPGRLCYNNHIVHPMILLAVELCLPIGVVVVYSLPTLRTMATVPANTDVDSVSQVSRLGSSTTLIGSER